LKPVLPSAEFRTVTPETSPPGLYHRFSPDDIEMVREADLDFLLHFGFGILCDQIIDTPRNGILSFHHADNRVNRGVPPGFWEWFSAAHQTGVTLQRLTEELDDGRVISRGSYQTRLWSCTANRRHAYLESQMLMVDAVARVAKGKALRFEDEYQPLNIYASRLFMVPGILRSIAATALLLSRVAVRIAGRLRRRGARWQLFVSKRNPDAAYDFSLTLRQATCLPPPPGRFWADPFIVQRDEGVFLFFEDLEYRQAKGKISYVRLNADATVADYGVALEESHHLSYPFVIEDAGDLFMIPEASASRKITLYRCAKFPDRWEPVTDILEDVSAGDATVLKRDGRYWLFTNMDRNGTGDHSCELHVFWAEALVGPWTALPENPVIVDAATARMAGGFIEDRHGGLYRCSQINGDGYGEGINFMWVEELTTESYRESRVESIRPDWDGIVAMHHIHQSADWITFDASH
jgi:hypothetical protein